jgi:hypothetical protein
MEVFNTVFHTEAFATYTPLALRREDGNMGEIDDDYRVFSDESQLRTLVEQYDSMHETLAEGSVSRDELFRTLFAGDRMPYRLGCAMIDRIEQERGIEAVRDAFYCSPGEFCETYDWALDTYRGS